jgi:small subunit ribosomal protein S20
VAHHIQAEKRNRQSKKRAARNKNVKSGVRSIVKKLEQALAAAKPEELAGLLKQVISKLDRAYSKGVLKRSTASRKVSQAARRAAAALKK